LPRVARPCRVFCDRAGILTSHPHHDFHLSVLPSARLQKPVTRIRHRRLPLAQFVGTKAAFSFKPIFSSQAVCKFIDLQPTKRDNKNSGWGSFEMCPSTKTHLEAAPKQFSAHFWS